MLLLHASEGESTASIAPHAGWTALHFAAAGGHAGVVAALLEYGAQAQPDGQGRLPLHLAALSGNNRAVSALLCSCATEVHCPSAPQPCSFAAKHLCTFTISQRSPCKLARSSQPLQSSLAQEPSCVAAPEEA